MPNKISIEDLVRKVGNKFLLTTAVSRRALQIKDGDAPLVEAKDNERPVEIALREMQNEKIVMGLNTQKTISRSEAIFQEEDSLDEEQEKEVSAENTEKALKKEQKAKKAEAKKKKTKSLMA